MASALKILKGKRNFRCHVAACFQRASDGDILPPVQGPKLRIFVRCVHKSQLFPCRLTIQLTDGGPLLSPEFTTGAAGPPFGEAPGWEFRRSGTPASLNNPPMLSAIPFLNCLYTLAYGKAIVPEGKRTPIVWPSSPKTSPWARIHSPPYLAIIASPRKLPICSKRLLFTSSFGLFRENSITDASHSIEASS